MTTVITMRAVRANIVRDLMERHPGATYADVHTLLAGLGWTQHATRIAIGDAIVNGRVKADETGRMAVVA
jgi:hypothetical protein